MVDNSLFINFFFTCITIINSSLSILYNNHVNRFHFSRLSIYVMKNDGLIYQSLRSDLRSSTLAILFWSVLSRSDQESLKGVQARLTHNTQDSNHQIVGSSPGFWCPSVFRLLLKTWLMGKGRKGFDKLKGISTTDYSNPQMWSVGD